MLTPVNTVGDVASSPQHAARQFWRQVEHPELGTSLTYPGSFYRTAVEPPSPRRAPTVGEHNLEVYGGLGLSPQELAALKEGGVI
jgi:crotonobetainyl-CoA:carnitine CoA-transferase CaiB-like acyl-CoA transferase